jgi:cytochrome c
VDQQANPIFGKSAQSEQSSRLYPRLRISLNVERALKRFSMEQDMRTTRTVMNAIPTVCTVIVSVVFATAGEAAVDGAKASKLAAKYNCQACHATDKKLVGPAYKDVAAKYSGDGSAAEKLEHKVKNGGSGVWGAIPMPPNNVPDADLKTLVEWVLSLQ